MSTGPAPRRGHHPLLAAVGLAMLAAVVGAVSGYAALGFMLAIGAFQELFLGASEADGAGALSSVEPWRLVLAPALGGLLVGLLTQRLLRGGLEQGPASVVAAVYAREGAMPLRRGLVSALASVLSIGAGASVGRYGPQVHLGATLGSWLGRYFALERNSRLFLVGAGVSAAVAAAFNAPLAGVLFAHEVVLRRFSVRSVMPTVVGAAVGALVSRAHGHSLALFVLPDQGVEHVYEYPLFVLVGLLGGGLAIILMHSVNVAIHQVPRLGITPWLRPAVGGLLLGCFALVFPETLGLGERAIQEGLLGQHAVWVLLALIPAKIIATSLSLGFGFYGGVLGPALFLGTLMGEVFGFGLGQLLPADISGVSVYAVAGMGVVVSRVVGAPIATILIVFELTGSYTLTTGAMIAIVVASVVRSDRIPGSLFHLQLLERGIDLTESPEMVLLRQHRLAPYVHPCETVAGPTVTVSAGLDRLVEVGTDVLVITDADGGLAGVATAADLARLERAGHGDEPVGRAVAVGVPVLVASMTLDEAVIALEGFTGASVPVIEATTGEGDGIATPMGVVQVVDLIHAYRRSAEDARREDLA